MNPDEEQARLRASFGDLRREDERRAPSFVRHWQAAVRLSQRPPPPRIPLVRLAAAVAAIAAVGVAAALFNSRPGRDGLVAGGQVPPVATPVATPRVPEPREQEPAASIEDWESPTASLLELSLEDGSSQGHGPPPQRGRESF